jgi:hypothetical protein
MGHLNKTFEDFYEKERFEKSILRLFRTLKSCYLGSSMNLLGDQEFYIWTKYSEGNHRIIKKRKKFSSKSFAI